MFWLTLFALALAGFSTAQSCPDCSYTSPNIRHFYLSNFTYYDSIIYSTPAHLAVAYGSMYFDFYNNATGEAATCTASSGQAWNFFYGNMVYNCTSPVEDQATATFMFNQTDGTVGVNETWFCAGNEYFGYATGITNFDCEHNYWKNPDWTWPNNGSLYSIESTKCKPIDAHLVLNIIVLGW